MPKRRGPRKLPAWYTGKMLAEDATLRGTWFRCRLHGATVDPLLVGSVAYCREVDCVETLVVVSSVARETTPQTWNHGPHPSVAP